MEKDDYYVEGELHLKLYTTSLSFRDFGNSVVSF